MLLKTQYVFSTRESTMQRKLTRGGSLPARSPLARSPLELGGTGDMATGTRWYRHRKFTLVKHVHAFQTQKCFLRVDKKIVIEDEF